MGALLRQISPLLFNNALGRLLLVNPGGYTDQMMAPVLATGSLALVNNFYKKVWRFDHWDLEHYLQQQGTTDTSALPVYPYRDDGLPFWRAINAFAHDYVEAYYNDRVDVAADTELQAWVAELTDGTKANLAEKGFPRRSRRRRCSPRCWRSSSGRPARGTPASTTVSSSTSPVSPTHPARPTRRQGRSRTSCRPP